MPDDAELLRRYARDRAEDAFAELVRRHLDGVYSAALRRVGGDTHLAEDVSQQVFVALARKAPALVGHPLLTGWLHTTTRHEAANIVRRERRRRTREEKAEAMREETTESSSAADWSRLAPVLDEAIDGLPERDRTAVLLRFVERRAFAEIGARLQLSEDAARRRVERALDKLRERLASHGVTSTAAALGVALTNQAVGAAPAGLAVSVTGGALAVGAAPWVTLLQFMANTKLTVGVAGLLIVAATITMTREASGRQAAESALADASRAYAVQLVQRHEVEGRVRVAEQESARLAGLVEAARVEAAAKKTMAPLSQPTFAELQQASRENGRQFLARHPEVRVAVTEWAEALVRARWGPLWAELGLSPAQIEAFQALVATGALVTNAGSDQQQMSLCAHPEIDHREQNRRLRELLGEAGYARYDAERGRETARDFTDRVTRALTFSETPLTPEQATQLTQILAGNRMKGRSPATEFNWPVVATKAADFLSAQQVSVLGGIEAEDRWRQILNRVWSEKPATTPTK